MKRYAVLSSLLLIAFASCKKQDFRREQPSTNTVSVSDSAPSSGDGLWDVLGYGYNATLDYANAAACKGQVIDVAAFKAAHNGRITKDNQFLQFHKGVYAENALQYATKLTAGIDASLTISLFKKKLSAGFSSSMTSSNNYNGKYIYASYDLSIYHHHLYISSDIAMMQSFLTPAFAADAVSYTPQDLVNVYGTHVLTDIFIGAQLDLMYQAETRSQNREEAAKTGIKLGIEGLFNIAVNNGADLNYASSNYSQTLYYRTRGGDPTINLVGTVNIGQNNPTINHTPWQNSSNSSNAVLVDIAQGGIIPIYEFISDPIKKASVKAYVDQYIANNQTYLEHFFAPVYGWYNGTSVDHFYSTDPNEGSAGYTAEGIKFYVYAYQAPNTVPVYRYWNSSNTDHFYTKNQAEAGPGYNYEGIAFYAFATQNAGTVPIHRYWIGGAAANHHYTKSSVTPPGYVSEGIEFYAY